MLSGMRPMWAALAFVILAGVLARALQAGVSWGGSATDWFQALGSVAAIFAAIGVAWHEGSREARRSREALKQYRLTVAVLACRMADLIEALAADLKQDPQYYYREGGNPAPFLQLDEVLAQFEAPQLESAQGALCLHDIRRLGAAADGYIGAVARDYESDRAISPDLSESLVSWPQRARKAASVLATLTGEADSVRQLAATWSR